MIKTGGIKKGLFEQGETADVWYHHGRARPRIIRVRKRRFEWPQNPQSRVRYFSMQLARLIFPQNVIRVKRVSERKGKADSIHSDYYPLPQSVELEGRMIRRMILEAHFGNVPEDKCRLAVKKYDRAMRKKFPDLIPAVRKLEAFGFYVPHPEINFTVHNGNIVFYEIDFAIPGRFEIEKDSLERFTFGLTEISKGLAAGGSLDRAKILARNAIKLLVLREFARFGKPLEPVFRDKLGETIDELEKARVLSRRETTKLVDFIHSTPRWLPAPSKKVMNEIARQLENEKEFGK